MSPARSPSWRRALGGLTAAFVVVTILAWGILSLTWSAAPVNVHVRWKSDVTVAQRVELERRFQLTNSEYREGTTWKYLLADSSTANIRAIVQDQHVDDTQYLNRISYRPEFADHRSRQILVVSVAIGSIGSILLIGLAAGFRRIRSLHDSWSSELSAVVSSGVASARAGGSMRRLFSRPAQVDGSRTDPVPTALPFHRRRATAAALLAGSLASVAMTRLAGASLWSACGALIVVYVCGYVVGSLLVARVEGASLAVIRTIAGLMLTSVGFLLSLVLWLPWFILPGALVAVTLVFRGRPAFTWSYEAVRFRWDGVAAGILAVILLSPIIITFFHMAPGRFPPVFYNVDTAYSLEKVHALVAANTFPPPSLSNLGVRRTYHYGTQAMAALISRSSGLLPHHALFLIVLPLLTAGVVAAAVAVTRYVSPALPHSVTVPLLLISIPSLTSSFWDKFGSQLWLATSSGFSIDRMIGDYGLYGILSNEAQNVGGDFLILGSIAGMTAAPSLGWSLPAFLIGSSILFKTTAGIALVAGFALSEAWPAIVAKRFRPSPQLLLVGAVFTATFVLFFLTSFESAFRVQLYPLLYLREMVPSGGSPTGFVLDVIGLFLPALIVVTASVKDADERSDPILLMAIAPFIVVNTTRLIHVGNGGGGAGEDWVQIPHSAPFLLHAFALGLASRRWGQLGQRRRVAFLLTMALAIAPAAIAAGRYSFRLLRDPASGNEFVDNQPLAEALALIPTTGSLLVTNDLRYPAQDFSRDDRQMQIPALFGHQAFAVNFSYEPVEERRDLQRLLQRPEWSDAILAAARMYHWTHFVVRKDYIHPAPIPLEQIFENDLYAVFRFP